MKEQGFHKVPEGVDMHDYDLGIFEASGQLFHFGGLRDENILKGVAPSEREGYQPREPYPQRLLGAVGRFASLSFFVIRL